MHRICVYMLCYTICRWLALCRAEEKGGLREFLSARVHVILKEIDEGLRMHNSCPSLIKNALTHEAVRGAYAIC